VVRLNVILSTSQWKKVALILDPVLDPVFSGDTVTIRIVLG
jgi:hypothetical protein